MQLRNRLEALACNNPQSAFYFYSPLVLRVSRHKISFKVGKMHFKSPFLLYENPHSVFKQTKYLTNVLIKTATHYLDNTFCKYYFF